MTDQILDHPSTNISISMHAHTLPRVSKKACILSFSMSRLVAGWLAFFPELAFLALGKRKSQAKMCLMSR